MSSKAKEAKDRIKTVLVLCGLSCIAFCLVLFHSVPAFGFSMSMTSSSDGMIRGTVLPGTASIVGSNTLTISSDCPDGYYVYMIGNSDNNLYSNGNSNNNAMNNHTPFSTSAGTLASPVPLAVGEWGISLADTTPNPVSDLFFGVTGLDVAIRTPADYVNAHGKGNYNANEEEIDLYYGLRAGVNQLAGTYTSPNDQPTVTYSLVPSINCVAVTINFDSGSLGQSNIDPITGEEIPAEVTGDMSEGTMSMSVNYGASVVLSTNTFTRTYYNFAGWSTKDNDDPDNPDVSALHFLGDGTSELISEATAHRYTDNGVLTLYPMWRGQPYTVKFYSNPYQYYKANTLIATIDGRRFTKVYNGNVLIAVQRVLNGAGYNGPALTSQVRDAVAYTTSEPGYGCNGVLASRGSFSYSGTTYYATNVGCWMTDFGYSNTGGVASKYLWYNYNTINTYDAEKALLEVNKTDSATATQSFAYGTAQNLQANTFLRSGMTFQGWATSPTGDVVYANQESVNNLTTISGGTVELWAIWQ